MATQSVSAKVVQDQPGPELIHINIGELTPHPKNPRLVMRQDVIEGIKVAISENGFSIKHAIHIRPIDDTYQIISGHHRVEAAKQCGLESIPCWLEVMNDELAYMELATSNNQGELSPLERGSHALDATGKYGDTKAYAESIGRPRSSVQLEKQAARVSRSCTCNFLELQTKTRQLAEIHSLPESTWPIAVSAMIKGEWSATETSSNVKRAKEFEGTSYRNAYPLDLVIRRHFEYPDFSPSTFRKLIAQCRRIEDLIEVSAPDEDREGYLNRFIEWVTESPRWSLADLSAYERTLDAGFKKSVLAAGGFKLGNWRDHAAEVADGSIALLLTDPPYGMNYQSNRRAEKHDRITNDGADEAANELGECLGAIFPKLADQAHLLVFVDWRNEPLLREVITNAGYKIRGSLIWKKNVHGSGDLRGSFAPMHERIIHAVKGDPAMVERIPDVLDSAKVQTSNHPTEKPVDLLERLIDATTVEGELVADPFAGVASTLVAAKRKSRAFWGCEISETYHQLGVSRL